MNVDDRRPKVALMVAALGVVYGDIGTSPLYALRECFNGAHGLDVTAGNILGVLSLILWTLIALVSVKYLGVILRANNQGEGGILALLALAIGDRNRPSGGAVAWLVPLGIFGAALLYGDGMLTPAITVLGAMEGLEVATPIFKPYVVPLSIAVLVALFSQQRAGTARMGGVFGPVMVVWFVVLVVLGVVGIFKAPEILKSLNPLVAVAFLIEHSRLAFVVMGAVFLAVTGAEALYADMGHFGASPIRRVWFTLVFPSLVLNYLGQGALLLRDPSAAVNPFYRLAPSWALYPMVLLATMAAVIASQALITGAYSLTMQAIQMGFLPRLAIRHTSRATKGQIYMPQVNWILMFACVGLVLGFRTSGGLAAAYGIAVSLTMVITSVLFWPAARRLWGWSAAKATLVCAGFLAIELGFLGANIIKIPQGGWFPLVIGIGLFVLMTTWKAGRKVLRDRLASSYLPWEDFVSGLDPASMRRVPGAAVFLSGNPTGTPIALLHNLKHNKVLHDRVVVLSLITRDTAHVAEEDRLEVEQLRDGFYRVTGRFGYMEQPDVPALLKRCADKGLALAETETTYFLSRETIIPRPAPGMALWRRKLFATMARNAQSAAAFFCLPANRVVELGMQIEL